MKTVAKTIEGYNALQNEAEAVICTTLMDCIDDHLQYTERHIWHGAPVWCIDENPIVGYSKVKAGIKLMFWSGIGFEDPDLQPGSGKFKDASVLYTDVDQVNMTQIRKWLKLSELIQWDYKNIQKRKGKLIRL